jgi:hypothetical protein
MAPLFQLKMQNSIEERRGQAMENSDFNTFELLIVKDQVIQALKTCFDPEIPVNIHELGLIYLHSRCRQGGRSSNQDDAHFACVPCSAKPTAGSETKGRSGKRRNIRTS